MSDSVDPKFFNLFSFTSFNNLKLLLLFFSLQNITKTNTLGVIFGIVLP